eukprot:TRINITY_DN1902_c0_g1_i1.p1 TRINITY_DN1902_c0_g1~~TRINITY_DN1902_c0_g1_i1.p1  ORF type:complete len:123 (-),score=8.26 TRINITY_DN1902_c0_g1_i1:42-410(-)
MTQIPDSAITFIKEYYEIYDKNRQDIYKYYRETSTMVWNGDSKQGLQAIAQFLIALPKTSHNIETIDSHPVQTTGLLLHVTGTVSYRGAVANAFSQSFMIGSDMGHFIAYDNFRLTTDKASY